MKANVIKFPNFFRPATPQDEPCEVLFLPNGRTEQECRKVALLRKRSRQLREHFKRQFSGGTRSGGEGC